MINYDFRALNVFKKKKNCIGNQKKFKTFLKAMHSDPSNWGPLLGP